jgi:transcriptional regulator with XRE-family HTH domain
MKNLRLIRTALGLTQSSVGGLSGGIPQNTISEYERGLAVTNPEHVTRIAAALGVSEEALYAPAIRIDAKGRVEPVSGDVRVPAVAGPAAQVRPKKRTAGASGSQPAATAPTWSKHDGTALSG